MSQSELRILLEGYFFYGESSGRSIHSAQIPMKGSSSKAMHIFEYRRPSSRFNSYMIDNIEERFAQDQELGSAPSCVFE